MSRRYFVLCVIVITVCIQIAMTILVARGASPQTVVVTVQYSIIGPSNGAGYPTFSYTANGKFNTLVLSGSSTDVTIDSGSTWSISSTLPGSNSSNRWAPAASSGVANSAQIRVNYYAQCLLGLGFVTIGGGKTPPSVKQQSIAR